VLQPFFRITVVPSSILSEVFLYTEKVSKKKSEIPNSFLHEERLAKVLD